MLLAPLAPGGRSQLARVDTVKVESRPVISLAAWFPSSGTKFERVRVQLVLCGILEKPCWDPSQTHLGPRKSEPSRLERTI